MSVRWIPCAVWQSAQTGAVSLPAALVVPWMPTLYLSRTPEWHDPQVAGMFARNDRAVVSSVPRMSCLPWQSAQAGAAAARPAFSLAHEWMLSWYLEPSSSWQLAQATFASV